MNTTSEVVSAGPRPIKAFAEREYIDAPRCCCILGCSWTTLLRLVEAREIDLVDFRARGRKRVRYASVVAYCDRLRGQYKIANRRPQLDHAILRHHDRDLLPFRLDDTVSSGVVMEALGFEKVDSIVYLLEEGAFEGYQLMPHSPWRISRSSLQRFIDRTVPRSEPGKAGEFTAIERF